MILVHFQMELMERVLLLKMNIHCGTLRLDDSPTAVPGTIVIVY